MSIQRSIDFRYLSFSVSEAAAHRKPTVRAAFRDYARV
jgi:hypothetical protein